MAHIPKSVAESEVTEEVLRAGLHRSNQGKIRDTFALADPTKLLVVATDRISIFDFVLNALVEGKGIILNLLTIFWLVRVFKGLPNHLVASGADIDVFLPAMLRGYTALQSRAVVVERQNMLPIEAIVRGYLTGSGWKDYQKTGMVCGIRLPEGLHDGSQLPYPIFTPSTKATQGHDQNITRAEAEVLIGQDNLDLLAREAVGVYQTGAAYAQQRGIIIADTKFEFGDVLADEVLTPDSSRFWDSWDYAQARLKHRSPTGYDKQPVRDAGKSAVLPDGRVIDISSLDPGVPEHLELVEQWQVPHEVLSGCATRYQSIYSRLTQDA